MGHPSEQIKYGLRQAPQLWNRCLDEFLVSKGFVSSPADACVYTKPTSRIILLIHVDDFAAAATLRSDLTSTFDRLNARFGLRNERYDKSLSRAHTTGNNISSELAVSLCHFARLTSLARH